MDGSNYSAGRDLDLSVHGDLVSGDKFTGDKILNVSNIQNIYQTIEREIIIARMAPPSPALFVGQTDLLFKLVVYLQETAETVTESAPALFLTGMAGVGKTAVAATLAHDPIIDEQYPDGTLWAELGPNPDLMTWLATWGEQLGTDLTSYSTLESRSLALSTLVHSKKILFVFDDVWQAADIRPLWVASAESQIIITTRDKQLVTILGSRYTTHFPIHALDEETALQLLSEFVPQAVQDEAATARELVNHLDGLPLAIILAGQTVASESQAGFSVAAALAELLNRSSGVQLSTNDKSGTLSLRAMLSVSYDHLPTDEARQSFRALAVFGARPRSFDIDAAAQVWGMDGRAAQKIMVTLVNQQMVEALGEGIFTLHNTFANFAQTLLVERSEWDELRAKHADYYLQLAQTYMNSNWRRIEQAGEQVRQGFHWVSSHNDYKLMVAYLTAMNPYFARRGLWDEQRQWTERVLTAVQAYGDERLEGILYSNLGAIYHQQGQWEQALSAYKNSSPILEQLKDKEGLAVVLNNMGAIYARLNLLEEAFDAYEDAQEILETTQERSGQVALATTLNNIGTLYQRQEQWFEALEHHQLSYKFYEALQDSTGLANTLNHIGAIYSNQQRYHEALLQFDRSWHLFDEAGDIVGESVSLHNLALIYENLGDLVRAEQVMSRLVEIEEQLNHPDLAEDRESLQQLRERLDLATAEQS